MTRTIERILLVDDEATFLQTLRRHLRREGFELETAANGRDACWKIAQKAAQDQLFDLVITDVLMPDVDGIQLLTWIKDRYPGISVIVLTGFGDSDTVFQALRPDVDGFSAKPITPQAMMSLIDRIDHNRSHKSGIRNDAK